MEARHRRRRGHDVQVLVSADALCGVSVEEEEEPAADERESAEEDAKPKRRGYGVRGARDVGGERVVDHGAEAREGKGGAQGKREFSGGEPPLDQRRLRDGDRFAAGVDAEAEAFASTWGGAENLAAIARNSKGRP